MTLKDNNDGTFSIVAPCSFEKPKPLSNQEILKLWDADCTNVWASYLIEFARAIEKAHGIQKSVE